MENRGLVVKLIDQLDQLCVMNHFSEGLRQGWRIFHPQLFLHRRIQQQQLIFFINDKDTDHQFTEQAVQLLFRCRIGTIGLAHLFAQLIDQLIQLVMFRGFLHNDCLLIGRGDHFFYDGQNRLDWTIPLTQRVKNQQADQETKDKIDNQDRLLDSLVFRKKSSSRFCDPQDLS